jgi:hypothetical protein
MKLLELKFNFEESSLPSPGRTPDRVGPVQVSPTKSNRIQPNPTAPSPPGKEIGKETVKFLATFDHVLYGVRPAERSGDGAFAPHATCPKTFWFPRVHCPVRVRTPVRVGFPVPAHPLFSVFSVTCEIILPRPRRSRFGLKTSLLCIKNANLGLFEFDLF